MKIRKFGIYFIVSLLMVCFVFANAAIQVFAAEEVTWNPNDKDGAYSLQNNNLTIYRNTRAMTRAIRATVGKTSGKWYWENTIDIVNDPYSRENGSDLTIGVANSEHALYGDYDGLIGHNTKNGSSYVASGSFLYGESTSYPYGTTYGESYSVGDVIGVALDMDNGTIEFFKNGVSQGVKSIAELASTEVYPAIGTGGEEYKITTNFGATTFKYAIPEGFSAYNGESNTAVLDIEPEKETIYLSETVSANLVINNINEIAAEDIRIDYDEEKLEFLGFEEVDGMKLVKSIEETSTGNLRVIVASKGEANIVNAKEVLLKLNFKGIETGEALVDITKGRVTDGIEMEKDLTDVECDQGTIVIEALADVNNSGEFTLLDLGIDARHLSKDPAAPELAAYNTDIVVNNAIDEDDLLEIGRLILENANYTPNN